MTAAQREAILLDRFWRLVGDGGDKLELLKRYSAVIVVRPTGWSRREVRLEAEAARREIPHQCFACLSAARKVYWHHVIQVQNGGGNSRHNLVGICHRCHQTIHPWLPEATASENRTSWVSMSEMVAKFLEPVAGEETA